jgi:hypothetical protein
MKTRLMLFLLFLLFFSFVTFTVSAQAEAKSNKKIAWSTLRSYEKTFYRLDKVGLSVEGKRLLRGELNCAEEIINGINKSKISDDEKFIYVWDLIIIFRAHALSIATKDRKVSVLYHGRKLKRKGKRLERLSSGKRGIKIARGLLGQEELGRDYLLMPEVNFCLERNYLRKEGYNTNSISFAYNKIITWDVIEWATSDSAMEAFSRLYGAYNAIANVLPKLKKERLLRFEEMYFASLLPWVKWRKRNSLGEKAFRQFTKQPLRQRLFLNQDRTLSK